MPPFVRIRPGYPAVVSAIIITSPRNFRGGLGMARWSPLGGQLGYNCMHPYYWPKVVTRSSVAGERTGKNKSYWLCKSI